MIKLQDGTILRNLEEQVQYLTNYHDVNQGLAQWGIRVVGQVDTEAELPDPATYEGEYGDTYAVGTEAPFDFYIWTRAAIAGGSPYWFPFGEISIVGPQGPQGEQGIQGETGKSTKIVASAVIPSGMNPGDLWLSTGTGVGIGELLEAYQNNYGQLTFRNVGNIRGPQGIQGIQGIQGPQGEPGQDGAPGPQGDVGGFINIWGILENSNQLPTPESLDNLTVAYLVGAAAPYDLYVQVGETSDTSIWENTGPFNAATAVSVEGVYQNVWDADTKLDKVTGTTTYPQVYTKAGDGSQTMYNVSTDVVNGAIPRRRTDGTIFVPTTTEYQNAAISKYQADNSYVPKPITTGIVRFNSADGTASTYGVYQSSPAAQQIPLAKTGGRIATNTPTEDLDCANKKYVDDNFLAKITDTTNNNQAYIKGYNGVQRMIDLNPDGAVPRTIVQRTDDGDVIVPDVPVRTNGATSKQYVDNGFLAKKTGIVGEVIITQKADGTTDNLAFGSDIANFYIVRRTANGDVLVPSIPVSPYGAINKLYVAPTQCTVTLNDGDNQETYTVTIPAFMKETPSAYVGACCDTDQNHVIVGYSHAMDAFIVTDLADDSHTSVSNYTINQ